MNKGRITEVHRTNFTVRAGDKEYTATVRGVFHEEGDFPKVGDYVQFEEIDNKQAVIETVLPRDSVIKRKAADDESEQIIAANVDTMLIVMGLDGDFNIGRLERYLLLAQQSEVPAVVVLNKSDVATDRENQVQSVEAVAGTVPVCVVSALARENLSGLLRYIEPEKTVVLLGSSGAGKSTITNWLLDEEAQAVADIRQDDSRGRHTTTSRQLFTLPNGGYLIDTPGMRELGVLESNEEDELAVFTQVQQFSDACKFRNCDHEKSAGCAVLAALESGELSLRVYQNYQKLLKERAFLSSKESTNAQRHYDHTKKREQQKNAAIARQKLSRR